MIALEIDGKPVEVAPNTTVIEAANQIGIFIPHFCYHRKLSIAANCRMCLVQVEKAPKPLPACATPATPGMKVHTHSDYAVDAQKSVMEFLLINHPLDCPICDQGGECLLQDLAVGYGAGKSRYEEDKRVVPNKNLGPLISTDMTRCIHCTRCVRFGQEIAGRMELGMAGRGEHAEILTFVEKTVDAELSGNMIDLCPVGALTSKPFRYTARPWELSRRKSISPHCGFGSNLIVQVRSGRVMRVLPRENEEINECWLSDKERFSYEGLNSPERLTRPMIKDGGQWRECDWQQALGFVADKLKAIRAQHGAEQIAALASPHQTLEELHLLQKLLRGIGSGSIDHRLRQSDFSADASLQGVQWLGMKIADLSRLDRVLVIGSNLPKDHPLIAHRLRQAVKKGAAISVVNPFDDNWHMAMAHKVISAPHAMMAALSEIVVSSNKSANGQSSETAAKIAVSLKTGQHSAIFLGNLAQHHPHAAQLHWLAQQLAQTTGATLGFLGEAANSVGAYLAGATPFHRGARGLDAAAMLKNPRKAYLLLGSEIELDAYNPKLAMAAMQAAEFVVALSAYRHRATDYAHVMLPVAPFSETSGTFVNTEGRAQTFNGVVPPLGETRPAWKVLRVLGNLLGLDGFDYNSSEQVYAEMNVSWNLPMSLNNKLASAPARHAVKPDADRADAVAAKAGLQRVGDVPIYQSDPVVRRAVSLQLTHDAVVPVASINSPLYRRLQLAPGDQVKLRQEGAEIVLAVTVDDGLPNDTVRVATGHPMTGELGGAFDTIEIERAARVGDDAAMIQR
ncbi:MAG: NADH-quinone oxidoreductase subunit G [Burkholderiales bacterium]|nr:NADH-quinone oxidoreductase subunit G [Burkholderiales bacterium]